MVENNRAGLEEIDLLRLQNAFLKLHSLNTQATNIKTQFEILRRDALRVDKEAEEAKENLTEVRNSIAAEYQVDLRKVTIDQEGKFVPLDPKQVPFPVEGGNKTE